MSNNCSHPTAEHVIDQHNGCIVCRLCAHVIDIDFENNAWIHTDNKCIENPTLYLKDVIENNCIDHGILTKSINIRTELRQLLPKRSILHLELFSLYYAALCTNSPYLICEVASMFGIDVKTASKILSSVSKATNYKYIELEIPQPIKYLSRLSSGLLFPKECYIVYKKYKDLPLDFRLKNTPLFIGSIIYNNQKNKLCKYERAKYLKKISNKLGCNERSIKLLDKKIDSFYAGNKTHSLLDI